jgi:gamma-glutamyl AIG2-like cyclotransferase
MPMVFLYGPDTLQARIYDRIGASEFVGGAVLDGYRLEFNKPNMKNKDEGLANIVEAKEGSVFGVLYDLTPKQIEQLDGYFGGYGRKSVHVQIAGQENGAKQNATAWIARRTKAGLRPTKSALDFTEKGAKENGAPDRFFEELHKIEVLHD